MESTHEPRTDHFGAWVSAQARQGGVGGVGGEVIFEGAHARNQLRHDANASAAPKASDRTDKSSTDDSVTNDSL